MSISDRIADKLRTLEARIPGVEASLVATPDGLPIASALPEGADEERVAAMCATAISSAERMCDELGKGSPEVSFVRSEKGYVLVCRAGPSALLMLMTSPEAKLGLLFLEMKRLAEDIRELIK